MRASSASSADTGPWQASYNRRFQYRALLDRGFRGWAVHLDADAWINDLDFDLPRHLADHGDRAAILAAAGVAGLPWDINNGVVLLNLGDPRGRRMAERWHADFMAIPDAELEAATEWLGTGNDQDLLQQILRRDPALGAAVHIESQDLINSRRARFIRQHLRSDTGDLRRRIANIAADVAAVMRPDAAHAPTIDDDRALFGLRHPHGDELGLAEAPAAPVDRDAAAAAIARSGTAGLPTCRDELSAALAAADTEAAARILARFGRSPAAEGLLGGLRQHRRAAAERAFARRRALRTQDALASLAEACGALPIENPGLGPWGFNVRLPAAELLDRIGSALGADVSPPEALGSYLGIDVGDGRVLHLRMIEALHSAWRIRQVQALLGLDRVVELYGGVGFRACYAHRLGATDYVILDEPVMVAIQTYLLSASRVGDGVRAARADRPPSGADLLFNEEALLDLTDEEAIRHIRMARGMGVRAILSVNHEARERDASRATMRMLVRAAGGFRLAQRAPHAIRPGFVEELFVAAAATHDT